MGDGKLSKDTSKEWDIANWQRSVSGWNKEARKTERTGLKDIWKEEENEEDIRICRLAIENALREK